MATLGIIVGSVREGRVGLPIAEWFVSHVRAHGAFEPVLLDLKPAGNNFMEDFHAGGSLPSLWRRLKDHLDLNAKTVNGETIGQIIARWPAYVDDKIIRRAAENGETMDALTGRFIAAMDEDAMCRTLEGVYAEELAGHRLIKNRSLWRNFPTIRCERWTHDNIVLLGDAKATAHFSIGSGTKLAMEDAIALHNAVERNRSDPRKALAVYEAERRPEAERIQHKLAASKVDAALVRVQR